MMPTNTRTFAITGGASGIGFAAAEQLVAGGDRVIVLDLRAQHIEAAVQALGGADHARGLVCDVTSFDSVTESLATIAGTESGLDGLVNAAGIGRPSPSHLVSDEDFHQLIDIHLYGTLRLCRGAFELLARSHGAIVNISSVAGRVGMPQRASYNTAKAAIEGLTRTLAVEWAPSGIRVNAVAPGYTATALTAKLIEDGLLRADRIEARTPLRRFAEPREIADPIVFLLGQGASYITGQTLVVDGGMTVDGDWY